MNSYKNLINNTIVYFIGILGSKLISFFLVPLYTHYLSTAEYGTADLITVSAAFLLPMITLGVYEAILRYSMDKHTDKNQVIKNALIIFGLSYIVFVLISPIFTLFGLGKTEIIYLYVLVFFESLSMILGQYARGLGYSKSFAFNGILKTLLTGVLNIIFIVYLDMGVRGYMFALILANLGSTVYLFFRTKVFSRLIKSSFDKNLSKLMLKFSLPLVPNSIMWSLINSSSKYIIRYNLGAAANGLFAISTKIPTIINMGSTVFSQAWQLSIIQEYEEDRDTEDFYTSIFRMYSTFLLIIASLLIVFIKPVLNLLFAEEYFNAWKPVPLLIMGAVFSAFSGFIGSVYTASKNTRGTLKTSIFGSAISLITNLLLIPRVGLLGAGLSSMISYFVMFIMRYYDTIDYIYLTINWKQLISTIVLIMVQTIILFLNLGTKLELIVLLIIFLIILIINRKGIYSTFDLVLRFIKSIFKGKKKAEDKK